MSPRKRLLEAAIGSLQEHGYARTTIRQIVASAGMHLPTVNYYFGSKERLLEEAAVEAIRRWGETTMAVAGGDGAPRERLRRSLERFLQTLQADRPYVVAAAEAFAQAERSEELRVRLAAAYREFRGLVAASMRPAAERPQTLTEDDLLAVSSTLIALFDGLAIQALLDPDQSPDADRVLRGLAILGRLAAAGEDHEA